jgi:hypothetical protein
LVGLGPLLSPLLALGRCLVWSSQSLWLELPPALPRLSQSLSLCSGWSPQSRPAFWGLGLEGLSLLKEIINWTCLLFGSSNLLVVRFERWCSSTGGAKGSPRSSYLSCLPLSEKEEKSLTRINNISRRNVCRRFKKKIWGFLYEESLGFSKGRFFQNHPQIFPCILPQKPRIYQALVSPIVNF